MQQGINIEEVKRYNSSLREYKEKSTKLRAELEFSEQELNRQCAELTTELGIQVTPDNIQSILEDRISKINNTMAVGNEILNRIKSEEASVTQANSLVGGVGVGGTVGGVGVGGTVGGVGVQPTMQGMQPAQQTQQNIAPAPPNLEGFTEFSGGLPPIFAK